MTPEDALTDWLAAHAPGAPWEEHPATHRVEDALFVRGGTREGHSKSLVVAPKDGRIFLLTLRATARADLRAAAAALGTSRLSFCAEPVLAEALGTSPGHCSPLCLVNDKGRRVAGVMIDAPLLNAPRIWSHPLRNTASVGLTPGELIAFVEAHHGTPHILDLARTV